MQQRVRRFAAARVHSGPPHSSSISDIWLELSGTLPAGHQENKANGAAVGRPLRRRGRARGCTCRHLFRSVPRTPFPAQQPTLDFRCQPHSGQFFGRVSGKCMGISAGLLLEGRPKLATQFSRKTAAESVGGLFNQVRSWRGNVALETTRLSPASSLAGRADSTGNASCRKHAASQNCTHDRRHAGCLSSRGRRHLGSLPATENARSRPIDSRGLNQSFRRDQFRRCCECRRRLFDSRERCDHLSRLFRGVGDRARIARGLPGEMDGYGQETERLAVRRGYGQAGHFSPFQQTQSFRIPLHRRVTSPFHQLKAPICAPKNLNGAGSQRGTVSHKGF